MLKTSTTAMIILLFAACTHVTKATNSYIESNKITHLLYLDLNDNISETQLELFETVLGQLQKIPQVTEFNIGEYTDVGDKRALSQYEYIVSMSFENKKAYDIYQSSPIHESVKNKLRTYLSGPPATYDFHTIKILPNE